MIDLNEVGAFPSIAADGSLRVRLGLYLPGIAPAGGYAVVARIIHAKDSFDPQIPPQTFALAAVSGHPLDLWTASVTLQPIANTHFGLPGIYLYRYRLLQTDASGRSRVITAWFVDPFAREAISEFSAFSTAGWQPDFGWTDAAWKTPELDDLVVYELHVEEFNATFDGVVERLPYLKSLGVNTLELMPVSSSKLNFDWGYGPLHYFAPNSQWGGAAGLKNLVNAAHAKGIAVILDKVYQHVDAVFPYSLVYANAQVPSPMIGQPGDFGPTIDFSQPFAQQYVGTANQYWLDSFHVDGFRYDEVTDLYTGPTDTAYAKIAYDTYRYSQTIPRFQHPGGGYSRIIQVAEALYKARDVLAQTYTSAAWTDEMLGKAQDMAARRNYVDDDFAHVLDPAFSGYPLTKTVVDEAGNPVAMPVAPFQYLESHDHSQLMAYIAGDPDGPAFTDRDQFYKAQPFAIALYTCQGVPMLWQGQELAESWTLPGNGRARINMRRDVHWEYFFDDYGSVLVNLYQRLGALRRTYRSLRSRNSYYYYEQSDTKAGAIAYQRHAPADGALPDEVAMVFLNFSATPVSLSVPFPSPGRYRELLDDGFRSAAGTGSLDIQVALPQETHAVLVPSNYGQVFITI